MKKFNEFAEALIVTTKQPESDSVGPVQAQACPCRAKDMLTQTVDDVLGNIQPTDGIGEYGQVGADGVGDYSKDGIGEYGTDEEASDVDLECMGDEGLKVKFNDMEILLPKRVIDKIKEFVGAKADEDEGETEPETEEPEAEESESEEAEESESEESEESEENQNESATVNEKKVYDPKAVCASSMEIYKKKGKGTKAAQAKRERKFEKCVSSVKAKQ